MSEHARAIPARDAQVHSSNSFFRCWKNDMSSKFQYRSFLAAPALKLCIKAARAYPGCAYALPAIWLRQEGALDIRRGI